MSEHTQGVGRTHDYSLAIGLQMEEGPVAGDEQLGMRGFSRLEYALVAGMLGSRDVSKCGHKSPHDTKVRRKGPLVPQSPYDPFEFLPDHLRDEHIVISTVEPLKKPEFVAAKETCTNQDIRIQDDSHDLP
jgi:hypothetical protein